MKFLNWLLNALFPGYLTTHQAPPQPATLDDLYREELAITPNAPLAAMARANARWGITHPIPKPQPVSPAAATQVTTPPSSAPTGKSGPSKSTKPGDASPAGPRRINAEGMALVEQFEGLDLHAYLDSVKVPTIAWGRIQYDDGSRVKMGDTCTRDQADQWLIEDLEKDGCQYVRHYFPNLNDDQYAALSSFTFNRGSGRLHQLVAMGSDLESIATNMLHFDYAGSETNHLLGLKRRRLAEQALFRSQPWRGFVSWGN